MRVEMALVITGFLRSASSLSRVLGRGKSVVFRGLVASAKRHPCSRRGSVSGGGVSTTLKSITDGASDMSAVDWSTATTVPNGVLAVYKPRGWSSAQVVGKVRPEALECGC